MISSMKTLGLWFVYLLGFATIKSVAAEDTSSQIINVQTELLASAILHAKANMQEQDQLVQNLMKGDIDALYSVAADINAQEKDPKNANQITSMMMLHQLADGPAKHAPSALALGHSYERMNKQANALQYFAQASITSTSPREAMEAQYNGGLMASELEQFSRALDFYRKCQANAAADADDTSEEEDGEDKITSEMSKKCKTEYKIISYEIRVEGKIAKGGVKGIIEMFPVASLDGFPASGTPQFKLWMEMAAHMENYEKIVRKAIEEGHMLDMVTDGDEALLTAQDLLDDLIETSGNGEGMSQLQEYLVARLNLLIEAMLKGHEGHGGGGHDEF